jgi:hypothetical protein
VIALALAAHLNLALPAPFDGLAREDGRERREGSGLPPIRDYPHWLAFTECQQRRAVRHCHRKDDQR